MNQQFLTTFSVVVIKHLQQDQIFFLGNQSFIRSQIFLSKNITPKQFQNSLFYIQVEGNNRQFNVAIQFQQRIMFRHKISNKYLSFSSDFEQQKNDTTYRLQLSENKYFFKIFPCFQYQTKISSKIKFGQDIYIASQINSAKIGYISTRETKSQSKRKTVLGLNYKSKFLLHSYYELQKQQTNYTFGSIIWLTHIQCTSFLTAKQTNQSKTEIMFESLEIDKDFQNIQGLWLIQSDKFERGGKLHFQQKFMLKNLYSGAYLSFSKNYKLVDNQRLYTFTLEQIPSEHSKFVFKSLKGEDNKIKKGSYLIFKNFQTNSFIGCRKKKIKASSNLSKPLIYYDFSDQDLYKILQLSQHESQAIRFIFSVRQELKYIMKALPKLDKNSNNQFNEIYQLYENIKKQLQKLSKLPQIYQKIQIQLVKFVQQFSLSMIQFKKKNPQSNQKSQKPLIIRNILKTVYEIIRMICFQNRSNQHLCWKHIHFYIDDFFINVGAQQLLIAIFDNNYELLCKVPQPLPLLSNNNIVKTIIQYISKYSSTKNDIYWINIQKIIKLFMTLICFNQSTIDINQRLLSQQLFQNRMFDKIFFIIKITGQRIKIQSKQTGNSKAAMIDIQQIKDPIILQIVQGIFQLLSNLCSNRNFNAKKAINKYLNHDNKQGPSILIAYLDIPISRRLLNNLYGLITNLYIDSCPRINRHKPLGVINFVFNQQGSKSENQQAEISSRLKDALLLKAQQSYRSRPLFISNILALSLNFQPTLTPEELDSYKDQINSKVASNRWSVQLLQSMRILINLQSYTVNQIIEIFDLMASKLQSKTSNVEITIGIMKMYKEIGIYNHQLELKKMTTYLKYKFRQRQLQLQSTDIQYLLPRSKKTFRMFNNQKKSMLGAQNVYQAEPSVAVYMEPTLDQYNNMQDILLRLYPSKQFKQYLFDLFCSKIKPSSSKLQSSRINHKTNQFQLGKPIQSDKNIANSATISHNKNLQYLKQLFKGFVQFNRPKYYFLKLLMNSIVVTKDQASTFQILFETYKNLKHLVSISQCWLCSNNDNEDIQKFFQYIDKITNYFYEGFRFQSKVLPGKRDYKGININRQLVIRNLGVYIIIFQLLQTNIYIIEKKKRKQINKKSLLIFEKCFEFLNHFIFECNQNKQIVHSYWHVLDKFCSLVQVGQTPLYIQLYKNHRDYIKQVKPSFVQKIINKIVKNNSAMKQVSQKKALQQCQFNPQYLKLLQIICKNQDKFYKPNIQKIYKFIQKQNVFQRIFFAEQKTPGKWTFFFDMYKLKTDPVQIPFIYHSIILKIINMFISELDFISSSLKNRIESMFQLDYLFQILSIFDIYSSSGIKAELNFLVKKQVLKLCTFLLDKSQTFSKLYQSQNLKALLISFQRIFVLKQQNNQYQAENQKFYIHYLEKERGEIQYFRNNQRIFYFDYVKPFMSKLRYIYEKLQNRQSIKNYQMLMYLFENIKPQTLSQNRTYKSTKNNIDLVEIKWRNFVDQDEQNSAEQKFAKRSVLQVLRNQQTEKLIQQQSYEFYRLIKKNDQKYINAVCQLLSLLMQQQWTQNDSDENTNQIYYIITNIQQYVNQLQSSQVDRLTFTFQDCQLIDKLIQYCNKSTFDFNKLIYKKIFYRILKIFNTILFNDEELRIHKLIYKHFQENMLSYRFLSILSLSIQQISERVDKNSFFNHVNNALGQIYLCVEEKKINLDKQGLRLITQLCSYNPFTSFLRFQSLYPSIDFLQKIYNSLNYILYQNKQSIKINVTVVDTAEQILQCISAMLTGGNKINQSYIIDNKFPQILNDVLKKQSIPAEDQQNLRQINQRDRLLEEVIQFYQSNGIDIKDLLNKRIKIIDFKHIYVLNRLKQALLRTLTECSTGNDRVFSKIKIQIPIQFLKINLIWIYQDFITSNLQFTQDIILRKRQPWQDVVDDQNLNGLFLMIGFYFYMLIECYSKLQKQQQDQDDDMADDSQKNKQKIIKKFFTSISQKQKQQEQIKSLEKQPFAQEMKQFYQKYYQSLQFFKQHTINIQINLLGSLAKIFFPKIPLCQKVSEQRIQRFKSQADRISQQQKIKSLLEFADQIYEQITGQEQFFQNLQQNYPYFSIVLKAMKYEQQFLFLAWILAVILTFLFFLYDYESPTVIFQEVLFVSLPHNTISVLMFIITMFNLYLAVCLLIYLLARKIPVHMRLLQKKHEQEQIQEGIFKHKWVYICVNTFFEVFYILFISICLIATFIHPMFAGFILVQILNRIQIGKQIIRSIKQTWFQLLVATALLVIINILYSALIYTVYYAPYEDQCTELWNCLLYLIDQSLKNDSGFLANWDIFPDDQDRSQVNIRFFLQVFYVVFAQKVIFQIFSGTIIDKFSQLRQQNAQMEQDQQTVCYICGQQRFVIDFQLQGFQQHTECTHNKMNYVFYLFYLKRVQRKNYGIVQKYIDQCQMKKKKDWIPENTSILKQYNQSAEQQQQEQDPAKLHQKYYNKKIQQLKKVKDKTETIINQLKGQEQL